MSERFKLPVLAILSKTSGKTSAASSTSSLNCWSLHSSNLVFTTRAGTPLDRPDIFRRSFKLILKKAGLSDIHFHDLRHAATSRIVQGVSLRVVMETLGHSRISLTMDTYSHVMPVLQREAVDKMEAILSARN